MLKVIIVGHHSRVHWIEKLQRSLPNVAATIIDYNDSGSIDTHRRALLTAQMMGLDRVLIMEDDAIPIENFYEIATAWVLKFPDELISFYLGTGRPKEWQEYVRAQIHQKEYITLPQLLHGVCYSLPRTGYKRIIDKMPDFNHGADYAIGRLWGRPVIYPTQSLVEHRDQGSVEIHPDGEPRTEKRVAHRLAGPLMFER